MKYSIKVLLLSEFLFCLFRFLFLVLKMSSFFNAYSIYVITECISVNEPNQGLCECTEQRIKIFALVRVKLLESYQEPIFDAIFLNEFANAQKLFFPLICWFDWRYAMTFAFLRIITMWMRPTKILYDIPIEMTISFIYDLRYVCINYVLLKSDYFLFCSHIYGRRFSQNLGSESTVFILVIWIHTWIAPLTSDVYDSVMCSMFVRTAPTCVVWCLWSKQVSIIRFR